MKDALWTLVTAMCLLVAVDARGAAAVDLLKPAELVEVQRDGQRIRAASAAEALAQAQPGDVIVLGPGTHQGPLFVETPNVTLIGQPGARVSANAGNWKPQWTAAPEYGPHAYRADLEFDPATVAIDHRVMIDINEKRGGPGIHIQGVGRSGRSALGGMFTWVSKSRQLVVSFAGPIDPSVHLIEAAPAGAAAITVRGADNCTVKNLIVTGGRSGIVLQQTANSTVENCLIYGTDVGVRITEGARGCKVLSCDITWNPDALNRDCDPATVPRDIWVAHKHSGTYDKHGILVDRAGEDNEIAYNYIYNVWDGIEATNGVGKNDIAAHYRDHVLKGVSRYNRGLKVHHNRIDLALDDAMRPGTELQDNQWYSNMVTRAGCAVRMSTIECGPFSFYDNVLLDSGNGLRLYKTAAPAAEVFIINNVIIHPTAVIYHKMDSVAWDDPWIRENLPKGTPGFRVYNNLFVCKRPFGNSEGKVTPNYRGDYNLYTSAGDPELQGRGIDVHGLFNAQPQFVDAANGDFGLADGSPGIGAGCDLAQTEFAAKLPATLASAASGRQPDVGLLGLEPQRRPSGPTSGLWEVATRQLMLEERHAADYTLEPVRWIRVSNREFVVRNLPQQEKLTLQCSRSANAGGYDVIIRDQNGTVLAEKTDKTIADKEGFKLDLPLEGVEELRISVSDKSSARWHITAEDCAVLTDAKQTLVLTKGDPGRFIFDYPVSEATASFTVRIHSRYPESRLEVRRPGGEPETVSKTAVVNTEGVSGTYQILVTFTKEAELTIEADDALVCIPPQQEAIALKQCWGKPRF